MSDRLTLPLRCSVPGIKAEAELPSTSPYAMIYDLIFFFFLTTGTQYIVARISRTTVLNSLFHVLNYKCMHYTDPCEVQCRWFCFFSENVHN